MSRDLPYWRIQAIQVAALGPYASVGRCFYCGADEALASFQPGPFSYRVACCRRCRESRTGIPDTRGLIHGTASISRPVEELTPGAVRGLIPSTTSASRPPEIPMHQQSAIDIDFVFAPWGSKPGELPDLPGEDQGASIAAELLALSNIDAQLDAIVADLDRMRDEKLGIATSSEAFDEEAPALTIDTIRELQAEMQGKAAGVERIIVGFPGCPFMEARKWETRRILFLGRGVLDAIARSAEVSTPYTRVDPKCEWSVLGVKVEEWGARDDHEKLLAAFVAELMAGPTT